MTNMNKRFAIRSSNNIFESKRVHKVKGDSKELSESEDYESECTSEEDEMITVPVV